MIKYTARDDAPGRPGSDNDVVELSRGPQIQIGVARRWRHCCLASVPPDHAAIIEMQVAPRH